MSIRESIYLDYQATTPVDKRVFDAMLPYFMDSFGNSSSSSHIFGWEANKAVEIARKQVADVINTKTKNIVFTSGATESNNLAIKGVANYNKDVTKNVIITAKTEHKCVLNSVKDCQNYKQIYLDVDKDGFIKLDELEKLLSKKDVLLVSIMGVNNEIGTIQPQREIGALCHKYGAIYHTDCAQAFGKIKIDVEKDNIDLMSISGHKIYGPKGIGAIYVSPAVKLKPILSGGGQERNIRSGTLAVEMIVGLGKAAELMQQDFDKDTKHTKDLFDTIYDGMMRIPQVYLNGSKEKRWFGNSNYSFAGIEGESIMLRCQEFAVSSGSACTSNDLKSSYVIEALGGDPELAHSSIRIGVGRLTKKSDVELLVKRFQEEVPYLRNMSPLWEQMQMKK
ncbi:MAG: aminotransferase class V-fold PLP-dependent enzyme [Rickettsiales bacterium]|jgi:cysteine desulfurase|nr:aminotransferase class V-fold PLP-dependent enzyme [Rickettsiales bacterium]